MTGSSSDAHTLETASYTLTVSGDPRFLPTVRALAAKTATIAGVVPGRAAELGEAVGLLMDVVVQSVASPAAPDIMDVRFTVTPELLRVAISCDTPAGARTGWTLERALSARGRLDAFRAVAPGAEFTDNGAVHICRLMCTLSQRS